MRITKQKIICCSNDEGRNDLVFDYLTQSTYRLTTFGGKPYEILPFRGFVNDNGFKFEVFTSQNDEVNNFLQAKTGALASPILKDGSFYVFGISVCQSGVDSAVYLFWRWFPPPLPAPRPCACDNCHSRVHACVSL